MNDPQQPRETIPWGTQTRDGNVILSPTWEVFVLLVSILSIVNLALMIVMENADIRQVVVIMDGLLTVVFAVDIMRRLVLAHDRLAYFVGGYGWLDALSTIPLLRILRLLRIARVIRVMQRLGGPGQSVRVFFANRANGGLLAVLLLAILVMEFGSLLVLAVERAAPEANITTADDAVWYLLVTMSTVGYGDEYPVTSLGRLIGGAVIVLGVGVFGTLTGFLANAFLAPSPRDASVSASSEPAAPSVLEGTGEEPEARSLGGGSQP